MNEKFDKLRSSTRDKGFLFVVRALFKVLGYRVTRATDRGLIGLIALITRRRTLSNLIILESHNDFDCNGGAFYDYLLHTRKNEEWQIAWMVRNEIPSELPQNVEAFLLERPSIKKSLRICTAKYLLCDQTVVPKVRSDQVSVYCTHGGITFKNVKGIIFLPESIDYYLSPSSNYDPIMCENYSIPYPNNKMLHLGFPLIDTMFNCENNEIKKITEQPCKKTILWMPTFRSLKRIVGPRRDSATTQPLGIPLLEDTNQLDTLNAYLERQAVLLVIKIHPFQDPDTILNLKGRSNIIVIDAERAKADSLNVYRLMTSSDAMISDYSSAAYTFMLLNRPLAFCLDDIEDYKLGFAVSDREKVLPGDILTTYAELEQFIRRVVAGEDPFAAERNELCDWLYEHRDANNCQRLAEFLGLI